MVRAVKCRSISQSEWKYTISLCNERSSRPVPQAAQV